MSNMKCPFCQQELKIAGEHTTIMSCFNGDCKGSGLYGEKAFWQELLKTKQTLDVAVDALKSADEYYMYCGKKKTLQNDAGLVAFGMDNIITKARDKITTLEQKEHFADASKKIEQKDN